MPAPSWPTRRFSAARTMRSCHAHSGGRLSDKLAPRTDDRLLGRASDSSTTVGSRAEEGRQSRRQPLHLYARPPRGSPPGRSPSDNGSRCEADPRPLERPGDSNGERFTLRIGVWGEDHLRCAQLGQLGHEAIDGEARSGHPYYHKPSRISAAAGCALPARIAVRAASASDSPSQMKQAGRYSGDQWATSRTARVLVAAVPLRVRHRAAWCARTHPLGRSRGTRCSCRAREHRRQDARPGSIAWSAK